MGIANVLSELGTGVAELFVNVANGLAGIFFTVGEAGAITVQPLGYISLLSLVLTIVYFVFRWIVSLFRRGRA